MRLLMLVNLSLLLSVLISVVCAGKHHEEYDDNDFAEFEDFEDVTEFKAHKTPKPSKHDIKEEQVKKIEDEPVKHEEIEDDDDDIVVQLKEEEIPEKTVDFDDDDDGDVVIEDDDDDNEEFSHFSDEEEFIGFDSDKPQVNKLSRNQEEPKITIAKVPLHLRSNWDSFYLEMLMVAGLFVYFLNFILGKGKNQKIAKSWFNGHKALLESNFALVGDDGKSEIENSELRKESENVYILWCSGRTMVEGMLIELRLLKRQDLIGVISQLIRPSSDQLIIKVNLDDMDSFVFLMGTKRSAARLAKDMTDIATYCPEKKSGEKYGLGSQFVVHSELNEISVSILRDPKVMAVLNKYPDLVDYFHFSDQYSGPKQQEDTQPTKLPEVKKTLVFCFNFPSKENLNIDCLDSMKPLMQLVLYLSDKISRLRLAKESKGKAEKNRSKVEEAFMKATHAARAEMAQTLREEKKRKERERIMSLDDPDKQRKWEEREQKRQMKRRAPKMKTLKIKPM